MKTTTARAPRTTNPAASAAPAPMVLAATLAKELMKQNPVSIRAHATVHEALALLSDHEFSAVPVIDKFGHPVGVLSRTDLVRYERQRVEYLGRNPEYFARDELTLPSGEELEDSFQLEATSAATVAEAMTPKVLSVAPETPAAEVVRMMLAKHVHRLFVVDNDGVLVGVISTMDLLGSLKG
ncbi:MAG TPA: CBS domain-containing protein [Planctomycetota bacterium]|nr:CBS domain-containing protein [Planctomycetota bacterium]